MSDMPPHLPSDEEDESSDSNQIDPSKELTDWELPLSFVSNRHCESIEGAKNTEQTWRMKEKVRFHLTYYTYMSFIEVPQHFTE